MTDDSTKVEKSSTLNHEALVKTKVGGRVKGTPNKKTEWIFELCEKLEFDPVETLIYIAKGDWQKLGYKSEVLIKSGFQGAITEELVVSMDHRTDAAKHLMKFMYPTRKAVDINTESENGKGFTINFGYDPKKLNE